MVDVVFYEPVLYFFVSRMRMIWLRKWQFSIPVASAAPRSHYKLAGSYVAGGEDADITDFPFMASIQVFGGHYCGAALLDSTHIFTAAHCAEGINP